MTDMRIMHMITRGVLTAKNAARKLRTIQCELFGGDVRDAVEDFEPYGYTAEPLPGAEVLVASLGGDREHSICVCHPDRRYRPTGLKDGEVMLYDWKGRKVFLSEGGIVVDGKDDPITVQTTKGVTVTAGDAVSITGKTTSVTGTNGVTIDAPSVAMTGNLSMSSGSAPTEMTASVLNLHGDLDVDGEIIGLADVAWSGSFSDLSGAPDLDTKAVSITLPTVAELTTDNIICYQSGKVVMVYIAVTLSAALSSATTVATGLPAPAHDVYQVVNTWASSYRRPIRAHLTASGDMTFQYGYATSYNHVLVYLAA